MNTYHLTGKTYNISGYTFREMQPEPCTDIRFLSQKNLVAMNTPDAVAELARREAIIQQRNSQK